MKRPAVLALDGGGSKVDGALVARDGTLIGAARWSGSIYDGLADNTLDGLAAAVRAVCADGGIDPERSPVAPIGVYCVAGADLPADDRRILRALRRRGWTTEDVLRNDTFAVLRAGTERGWGIGVVCGSGINCSGVAPDGRMFRFPAIGEISGDWGGGLHLGSLALWHAIRAADGRGERTSLATLAPAHFGMRHPRQVMEAVYLGRLDGDRLAELVPTLFGAAAEGDPVSRCLVDRQADEIVLMARTAVRKLRMTKLDVEVVLGGGIFRNPYPPFYERIERQLAAVAPRVHVTVLGGPPVLGAALLGLDRIGAGRAAASRLRTALTHARLTRETRSWKE